jgi:5-methylcytosine-specific restriction enzyme A
MHNAAQLIREGVATGSLIDVTESVNDLDSLEDDDGVAEGQLLARKHFARERDRGLREKGRPGRTRRTVRDRSLRGLWR